MAAVPYYGGTPGPYLLFHAACALLAIAAFLPPVAHGFSAFSIFLLLGFWLKVVTAAFGLRVLIEPVGDFAGSADDWDATLTVAAMGLTGAALAKLLWWASTPRKEEPAGVLVPAWYAERRPFVWAMTVIAIIAANAANSVLRFYMVGVHARVVLPFHMNVVVAWWLTVGAAMWLATLLEWERRMNGAKLSGRWMLIPIGEALVSTISMLSRGFYLMKTLPYALALMRRATWRGIGLRPRTAAAIAIIAFGGFGVSLIGVSWLRILIYPAPQRSVAASTWQDSVERAPDGTGGTVSWVPGRARIGAAKNELGRMVIGRWIGLEGVLAVSSAQMRSMTLLKTAITEDPGTGNAALYQRLSRSKYKPRPDFTFLTVPGVVGVLWLSGSYWVVLLGMTLVTWAVLATEAISRRLMRNDLLCAVAGVAMANALVQMNFPYLTAVFFLELWAAMAGLWVLSVMGTRPVHAHRVAARTNPI